MALKIRRQMIDDHYRPATINGVLMTAKREFRFAIESGWISENPFEYVRLVDNDDAGSRRKPISEEDLAILRSQLDHMETVGRYMSLMLCNDICDIPMNMLLAACVSDFDKEHAQLTLRGTIDDATLTFSPRTAITIHVTTASAGILEKEIAFRNTKKAKCPEGKWDGDHDFIFCGWTGRPIDRLTLNSYIRVIQWNTGFSWFNTQRLHGHNRATSLNASVSTIQQNR